jgi:PIN domain nuclease of toxin-antitoxin system
VLLLDTHAWIWTVEGDVRRVGRRSRRMISQATAREAVRVSAATLFEIVALHTAGRLRLARPLNSGSRRRWIAAEFAWPN